MIPINGEAKPYYSSDWSDWTYNTVIIARFFFSRKPKHIIFYLLLTILKYEFTYGASDFFGIIQL